VSSRDRVVAIGEPLHIDNGRENDALSHVSALAYQRTLTAEETDTPTPYIHNPS